MNDILTRAGWVEVLTSPKPLLTRQTWSETERIILKAVYRRHGRRLAAYTLGRPVHKVQSRIDYDGFKRYPARCADMRGGLA